MTFDEILHLLVRGILAMPRELDPELAIDAAKPALRRFIVEVRSDVLKALRDAEMELCCEIAEGKAGFSSMQSALAILVARTERMVKERST